jgi:hypothetical protein
MNRRVVAAVWIMGATVPLLIATAFLVGCCVLPFHGVMHKLMPLCEMAVSAVRGDSPSVPVPPARDQQEPVKRIITMVPVAYRLAIDTRTAHAATPAASTTYRSFISLGATRCDRDVGLHVLVDTFRI